MVTCLHAVSTTLRCPRVGRIISMRSVSPVTFWPSAPSSQNRWPNSWVVSLELMSFSIRSVARPLNGVELLCVGVVE